MRIPKAFMLGMAVMIVLTGCTSKEKLEIRPVETRESDQPLRSEPSEYTITAKGKVTDKVNGKEIPNARGMVVTIAGTYTFEGSTFQVSFPAMSVVHIRAEAPGHKPVMRQLKAHYERTATLDVEIRLEPVEPVEVTPRSL